MKSKNKPIPEDYAPRLLFGALSNEDATALSAFANNGKNIVLEFNSFATPTKPPEREIAEGLVGLKWTRWSGVFSRSG